MSPGRAFRSTGARIRWRRGAAIAVGLPVALVAGIGAVRLARLLLLVDPEPTWAVPRLLLGLAAAAAAASAGVIAAAAIVRLAPTRFAESPVSELPLSRRFVVSTAAITVLGGALLRLWALDRLPEPMWVDDVTLVSTAMSLEGSPRDLARRVWPVPGDTPGVRGSVPTLYLEVYRLCLRVFGTTVFGVRIVSAAAGIASLLTAGLIARLLLPPGGAALAMLALAGLRWQLILSRWGWNAIVVAPVMDLAAALLILAIRRRRTSLAFAAGACAGVGGHIYLASWIAAGGLAVFAAWPLGERLGTRLRRALLFSAGFVLVILPLLVREGSPGYFVRLGAAHSNAGRGAAGSRIPILETAADAFASPWLLADPVARHDLYGASRLGWIVGSLVLAGLIRALLSTGEAPAGFLLAQGGVALLSNFAWGPSGLPNGYRYAYLTTTTAVAAAFGALALIGWVTPRIRRAAALAAFGALAVAAALGARDALLRWPERPATFASFNGQDTLIGRAAARWETFGDVEVSPRVGVYAPVIGAVRRFRLDPDASALVQVRPMRATRRFRIASPPAEPLSGERIVERVRDPSGREWGVVLGRSVDSAEKTASEPGP